MGLIGSLRRAFSYDAVVDKGKRRSPARNHRSEDKILDKSKRDKLTGTTRGQQTNFTTAGWMVRKHLDYVSSFTFQARTPDPGLNREIESFMAEWSKSYNCDISRRHPFRRMIRLLEARSVIDGDCGLLKVGSRLQPIEGDRVRNPTTGAPKDFKDENWTHGIRTSAAGAAQSYCISKRDGSQMVYQQTIPAKRMFWHGYYQRFDQIRGISPLAAAVNSLQDVYENFDYALAKSKASQLIGLAIYRDASEMALDGQVATVDSDGDDVADSGYEVDFGSGPMLLDLDPGDRAEFLESKNPSSEFQNFSDLMIQICLKALDIPMSFFREDFTNYAGSRGALVQYLKSVEDKQANLSDILDAITKWRLGLAVFHNEIILPRSLQFSDLKSEWIPNGVAWWDASKEVKGQAMAIGAGLDTFDRVARQAGMGDVRDIIDANVAVLEYAKEKGYPLTLPGVSAFDPAPEIKATDDE